MMKRFLSLVLCLMLIAGIVPAFAEYEPHVSFTINAGHTNSEMDYTSDDLYKMISGKFNFDFEVYPVSKDAQKEKIITWVNGGTMPDSVTMRDFDYQMYVTWAEQGLLAPLPEGWEEKYPDLYSMVQTSGIYDQMKIDGLTYGIPHATFARFSGMQGTVVSHLSVYYRKDWAEKLGITIGDTITLKDYEAYLKACIDNDMAGNGNTIGFTDDPDNLCNLFMLFSGVDHDGLRKVDGKYVWNFADPGVLKAIKLAREAYEMGVIDPDFYLNESADATNKFTSGVAASMFINCAISSYMGYKSTFEESTGLKGSDCMAITTIADEDGTPLGIQTNNWWAVTMFRPEIAPETQERLLAMMDWICSEEGQLNVLVGIEGKDWEMADGAVKVLPEADGSYKATVDKYNSYNVFRTQGILADDYSFINPSNDQDVVAQVKQMYATRKQGKIILMDMDYEFFSSDNKAAYSLKLSDEVARLVVTKDIDVDAEWQKFIDDNAGIWQPVVDDLNEAFCK